MFLFLKMQNGKMKNSEKLSVGTAVCGALMMMSSCATIVSGGAPKITIDGDVREPVTIYTEADTYKDVTLPAVVRVRRHAIDGQRVRIKSENNTYKDIVLMKKTNNWAFGNIVLGGLIGWAVDLGTNCVSMPSQKRYYIEAVPKSYVENGSSD